MNSIPIYEYLYINEFMKETKKIPITHSMSTSKIEANKLGVVLNSKKYNHNSIADNIGIFSSRGLKGSNKGRYEENFSKFE